MPDKIFAALEEKDDRLIGGYSSNLSFVEKYRKAWISVVLNLKLTRIQPNNITGSGASASEINAEVDSLGGNLIIVFERYPRKFYLRKDGYQKLVFICIAESIETPNERIPSLVRFYPIKNYVCGLNAGQLDFTLRNSVDKVGLGFTNREVNIVKPKTGLADNFDSDMVKSGPEIMNDIAYNDGDILREGFSAGELKEFVAGIRICINENFESITVEPFSKARIKLLNMFSGTFAF
jgi:hypothetical protein